MITSLILSIVVLICLGLILTYALPPLENAMVQWGIRAIAVLIAVLIILKIWGIGI